MADPSETARAAASMSLASAKLANAIGTALSGLVMKDPVHACFVPLKEKAVALHLLNSRGKETSIPNGALSRRVILLAVCSAATI